MRLDKLREAAAEYEDIVSIDKNEYKPATVNITVKLDYDKKVVCEFIEQNFSFGMAYDIIVRVPCYECDARAVDPNEPDFLICLADRHHAVTETNLYITCPMRINFLEE